jgi:hypothetical protein
MGGSFAGIAMFEAGYAIPVFCKSRKYGKP